MKETNEMLAQRAVEFEDPRPRILVNGRYMRDITADCLDALKLSNEVHLRFFSFGNVMVELVGDGHGRMETRHLTGATLKGVLDRLANFVKLDRDVERPARPPGDVIADILALRDLPLPLLQGLIQAPVFSQDGELETEPGFQARTGYYLNMARGLAIRAVPERPSAAEIARAKVILLEEFLGDFPFRDDSDRAHALCALLHRFVRLLITGPTPLHMIESPSPGTGKGLLADTLTIPALGTGPSVMSEGGDEDEWRKRLTGKLLASPQVIRIDNVRSRLDSAALSAALTADIWEDRILGESRMVAIPVNCLWLATANNPASSLEVSRRTVSIRLDSGEERPWERTGFRHPDLKIWAQEHRAELVWAALTLAQAWVAHGRPSGQRVLGTYESWAKVMGGMLDVAGIPGFLGNRDYTHAAAEQEISAWAAFFSVWWNEYRELPVGTDLLIELARKHRLLLEIWGGRDDHGGRTRFGMALSRVRDRVIGGYLLQRGDPDPHTKAQKFRISPSRVSRSLAEPLSGLEKTTLANSTGTEGREEEMQQAVAVMVAGLEKAPQPPATSSGDPWDPFLEEENHGVG